MKRWINRAAIIVRPTKAFFLSSNDNGKDLLKSGQPWSEELGAPHPVKSQFRREDGRLRQACRQSEGAGPRNF